jgi:hypothetical protein
LCEEGVLQAWFCGSAYGRPLVREVLISAHLTPHWEMAHLHSPALPALR